MELGKTGGGPCSTILLMSFPAEIGEGSSYGSRTVMVL